MWAPLVEISRTVADCPSIWIRSGSSLRSPWSWDDVDLVARALQFGTELTDEGFAAGAAREVPFDHHQRTFLLLDQRQSINDVAVDERVSHLQVRLFLKNVDSRRRGDQNR